MSLFFKNFPWTFLNKANRKKDGKLENPRNSQINFVKSVETAFSCRQNFPWFFQQISWFIKTFLYKFNNKKHIFCTSTLDIKLWLMLHVSNWFWLDSCDSIVWIENFPYVYRKIFGKIQTPQSRLLPYFKLIYFFHFLI